MTRDEQIEAFVRRPDVSIMLERAATRTANGEDRSIVTAELLESIKALALVEQHDRIKAELLADVIRALTDERGSPE